MSDHVHIRPSYDFHAGYGCCSAWTRKKKNFALEHITDISKMQLGTN